MLLLGAGGCDCSLQSLMELCCWLQVKAMLGIKREGGASMPPPPSRQRKS